jgi:hypothetical protein
VNTRLLNGLSTYGAVTLLAFSLAASHHLDVDDHSDEWATSASLGDAQRQAAADLRRDLAAAELCRIEHGEAGFTWTAAGALVCLPRRGKPVQHAEVSQ